jgi:hypothetical protein
MPTINELRMKRNEIVKKWTEDMEAMREARSNGGFVDWEKWDALTDKMSIDTAEIDMKIWNLGGEV